MPTTRATTSITAKVTTYCASLTAKLKRGGTKKKSKNPTPRNAAMMAGPRPKRSATPTTTLFLLFIDDVEYFM